MKYIIDIPSSQEYSYDKDFKSLDLKFHDDNFSGMTRFDAEPYNEPDRKAIEDEVWEFAWRMLLTTEDFDVTMGDSYQEAKSKYEAWLKKKDEIRVGDEVKDHEDIKAVVLDICMDGEAYVVYTENRICEDWLKDEGFVKTGRHFDEVEELLKKMRGEAE